MPERTSITVRRALMHLQNSNRAEQNTCDVLTFRGQIPFVAGGGTGGLQRHLAASRGTDRVTPETVWLKAVIMQLYAIANS